MNQPGILDFLHEMKQEVLEPRNVMTVAEAPGVPIEQIHEYVDEQNGVFNMIFQFDHVDLDAKPMAKGIYHPWKLTEFKHALSKWQIETANKGWMALLWRIMIMCVRFQNSVTTGYTIKTQLKCWLPIIS